MARLGRTIGPGGVDYGFSGWKWCRHKEQFVTTTVISSLVLQMACSNCGAVATGSDRQQARDALMKVEREGTVSETTAP